MKLLNKFLLLALSIALFTTSCSSDDDATSLTNVTSVPLGAYENGYFILSEGGSASVSASIDFISADGTQTNDVFRIENPMASEMGTYLQNIFFDDTRAFILAGSTNTITVVNRYTFEYIETITSDLENPRYGTVVNGKAYVTNLAGFASGTDDYVTVIDLSDYSTSKILVGDYMNRVAALGDKVIIANGAFGSGNGLTFINTNTDTFTSLDLGVGNSPDTMSIVDDTLYVLTTSKNFITVNPSTEAVTSTLALPSSLSSTKNLQIANDEVYFTSSNSVYSFGLGDTNVSSTPILSYATTSAYGSMYGFAVSGNKIYIADAGDFASSGRTFEYTTTGNLVKSYTTSGFGPNGFYFN